MQSLVLKVECFPYLFFYFIIIITIVIISGPYFHHFHLFILLIYYYTVLRGRGLKKLTVVYLKALFEQFFFFIHVKCLV